MSNNIFETPVKDIKFKDLPAWQVYILTVVLAAVIIGSAGTALIILLIGYVLYQLNKK